MGTRRLIALVGFCAMGFCTMILPSCLKCQTRSSAYLRADSNLVLVPVTVSDPHDHPVKGLTKENFRILDDGVEQAITHFALDDAPMSIGLVFDSSGSMRFRLDRSRLAAEAFFHAANPEDEFFLVEFSGSPKLSVPLTRNVAEIENRITQARPAGRTALLDAIYLALNEMRKSRLRRKALLIVSDGGDNASRYTQNEVNRLLRESDVLIYAIGIFTPFGPRRSLEELAGPDLLRKIAERSGGRLIPISGTIELPYMAVKVGMEMRNRYLLGYSPADILDNGRYHRVQVKLVPPPEVPPLHALWRTGYYAPAR